MPGFDGTGPMGMGPMTGRALGVCAGYPQPGYATLGGRGMGMGFRGGGRGWRNMFYATGLPGWARGTGIGAVPAAPLYATPYQPQVSPENELALLKGQAKNLEDALNSIKERVAELETEKKK